MVTLAILQGRRLDGTLDLDLPSDITRSVRPSSLDAALQWLRKNYPLDEDAAILARIEREELQEEEKLVRRAEELGLYKPQSGSYGAELGDSNDPYGKSVLKETRKRNEARLLAEQEKKRQEWLDGEQKEREKLEHMRQKNTALQRFEDTASLEVHDEIGRGDFLALYLASGVFGSFTSLTANILKGNLGLTALGASGAISALVAAWCMLHADEEFTFFFLPPEWQEVASAKGWMVLTGLVALEFVNMFTRRALIDYWAHLGGFLAGALWSAAYKMQKENERRKNRTWFERTFRG
ncbi:hypothetical protein APSETT445_007773 [Aspergillus pseudonomiae]